jgi:hypothetical protein
MVRKKETPTGANNSLIQFYYNAFKKSQEMNYDFLSNLAIHFTGRKVGNWQVCWGAFQFSGEPTLTPALSRRERGKNLEGIGRATILKYTLCTTELDLRRKWLTFTQNRMNDGHQFADMDFLRTFVFTGVAGLAITG